MITKDYTAEVTLAAARSFVEPALPIIERLQQAEWDIKQDGKIQASIVLTLDEIFIYQRLLSAMKGLCK